MSKTVTLRLPDNIYSLFRSLAQGENRSLSNFIETSTLRYIEEHEVVDEFEMEEIKKNKGLNQSLKNAFKDVKAQRGQFVG